MHPCVMQFFSSFCLTLSNYLLSGIQSTQLFAKHCLACQIIHSSVSTVLGSFRHLTFRQWTFRRRHFGSLDVSAHVRFGTADISTHGRYGTGLFRHRDISARGTFRHMDVSAPWTFRHMDISARQTFRHVDISAPWTFRHVDISARWTFRHGDFSTLDFSAQVFSAHFRSGIF